MSQKKKNNIIIGSLCAVVLLMVVGYAAFSSVLNIKGTSSISSNWSIKITQIEEKNIVGGAATVTNEAGEKKISGIGTLTASFETNLVSPGDSIEYDITVANEGTVNAKLDKITLTESNNPAIKFTSSGLEEGSELNAGETAVLTVKVEYLNSVTSQPDNKKGTLIVTLDYSQKEESINATYNKAYYSCSTGTLIDNKCEITTNHVVAAIYACPTGYISPSNNDTCYYEIGGTKRACTSSGYTWSDELDTCYDQDGGIRRKTYSCSSGYTYNSSSKTCQKEVKEQIEATYHEAYYSCPEGYTLTGDKCFKNN